MKLLIIANSLEAGGAEKSAVNFAKAINNELSYQVSFATFRNGKKDLYQIPENIHHYKQISSYTKADKIPVRLFRLIIKPIMAIKDLYKLRLLILQNNYDVVISFCAEAGCMTFLSLIATRIPQITSERIPPNPDIYKPVLLARILRPYIYKKSVICSVQSKKVKNWVAQNWKVKSYLTPNFFELSTKNYSRFPENGPVITIGRATYQKGYDILLLAWSEYQNISDRELWIVCDDPSHYVKNFAKKLKIRNLKIIQPQLDIINLFEQCSLYISTSRFEGYPNAVTESLIFGLPVLCTDSSDVVREYINKGICLEIKDTSKNALSAQINSVLKNNKLLINTSLKAIKSQNDFTWCSVRQYWFDAIHASINEKKMKH